MIFIDAIKLFNHLQKTSKHHSYKLNRRVSTKALSKLRKKVRRAQRRSWRSIQPWWARKPASSRGIVRIRSWHPRIPRHKAHAHRYCNIRWSTLRRLSGRRTCFHRQHRRNLAFCPPTETQSRFRRSPFRLRRWSRCRSRRGACSGPWRWFPVRCRCFCFLRGTCLLPA